ncbi:antitoxin [Mariniluteicoccus flavus]
MGIFDKARDMIRGNEKHVDTAVDKAGDLLDQRTGGKHAEHVDRGQDFLKQQYGGGQASDPVEPAPGQNPDLNQPGSGVDGAPVDNEQDQGSGQQDQGFQPGGEPHLDQRAGDPTPGQEGMGLGSPENEPGFGPNGTQPPR